MKLRMAALSLCVVAAFFVGATGHASARAASCYGSSCAGADPYYSGCSANASQVGSTWHVNDAWGYLAAYVHVWHSNICQSLWADAVGVNPGETGQLSVWNPGRASQTCWWGYAGGCRTRMIDDRWGIQSCWGSQVYLYGQWNVWRYLYCY
jgi:hypothetical protein